jgi:hypothetical protein
VKALELTDDVEAKLAELRALSDRAEKTGDPEARRELKRALRESSAEVVVRASDLARKGRWVLIKTAAAGSPLAEEALLARLDLLRAEVGGETPTPLEALLAERICSLWILLELLEVLTSAQLGRGSRAEAGRVPHSYLKFYLGWQEQAHRRFLSAIRELGRVRGLLRSGIPAGARTNVQINLSAPESAPGGGRHLHEHPG